MGGQALPVIVGFGGINGAGRVSGHHAFRRMVYSALPRHSNSGHWPRWPP